MATLIKKGRVLDSNIELEILELNASSRSARRYIKKYGLSKEAELKMFELDNAIELVKMYTKWHKLCKEAEIKMLEHPNSLELAKLYIDSGHSLCHRAQQMLLILLLNKE